MRIASDFEGFIRKHYETELDRPGTTLTRDDVERAVERTLELLQYELGGGPALEGCESTKEIEDWLLREAFDYADQTEFGAPMTRRIDGVLYNPASARAIGTWSLNTADHIKDDSCSITQTLYVTNSGKYFLYVVGPTESFPDRPPENKWVGHEDITPLDPKEARHWARKRLSKEEYDRAFGAPDFTSEKRKIVSCSIPVYQHRILIQKRAEEGGTISSIIEKALDQYLGIDPTQKGAP